MEELENSWNKLAPTKGEQEIVEIEDCEIEVEQDKYCLAGSLSSTRPFNHQAMMGTMKTLWKPLKGVDTDVISDNKFLFTFYNRADLERRPWTFDKHVLLMEQISSMEQPSRVALNTVVFWLRIYNLLAGAMKESIIRKLGSKAGRVINIGY